MKSQDEMAMKWAAWGGVAGLALGAVIAVFTLKQDDFGILEGVDIAVRMLAMAFATAVLAGFFAYAWPAMRGHKKAGAGGVAADVLERRNYLQGVLLETKRSFADVTNHVAAANSHLDAAEKEFAEGAFAPFWDEIEHAANALAGYKNDLEYMRRNVDVYKTEAAELEKMSELTPSLQLPAHVLPDARPVATRFSSIVRKAQTNFQFAVIYEQRKTNQLLHAGFGTLGAAIYSLGESISVSMDALSKSLNTKLDNLLHSAGKAKQPDIIRKLEARQIEHKEILDSIHKPDHPKP